MLCPNKKLIDKKVVLLLGILLLIFWTCIAEAQKSSISLSEEERKWLANHRILKLGVGVAFPPYMWVENKDGAHIFKGMVSDYVDLLAQRLDVDMQIVLGIPFNEALERGKVGQIDFFPCLSKTAERSGFLLFTEPYLTYPMVVIAREDAPIISGVEDLAGKRFAVVKHLVVYSKIQSYYPNLNLNYVFTHKVSENLEAVSLGRADACIINLAAASYYIQAKGLTNLRVTAPVDWTGNQLSMGVRKDWPLLQGILEKGLASISQEERDRISQRWIRVNYEPGVNIGLIWRWSLGVGSALAILLVLVLAWNRRLQNEVTGRKKAEKEREKVIGELQATLDEVKTLQGFIPICATCKSIRDDEGYWKQIEQYFQDHSDAQFSHSICPDCAKKLYPDLDLYSD